MRVVPLVLALILAACTPLPAVTTGALHIRNPLATGFQAQVIPAGTERIAVLLADGQDRAIQVVSLDRSETTRVITGLPVGPMRVVVAAFDPEVPLAAADVAAEIVASQTTQVVADLSTDPALLARLDAFLALMADRPRPSPSPSAQPSASALPSVPPSTQPLPSLAPFPSLIPLPGVSVDDTFTESAPNPFWWTTRLVGNPQPTMVGGGGLTVTMAAGSQPAGAGGLLAEIETLMATDFDVQAEMSFKTLSWPAKASGTRIGLYAKDVSLVRDGDEYVLSGGGERFAIPAPAAGGSEKLRLVRQGATMAGYAGSGTRLGTVPIGGGSTSLIVGMRSDGQALSGGAAKVKVERVSVMPAGGF